MRVYDQSGSPREGAIVLLQQGSNPYVPETTTGPDGIAHVAVSAGDTITAAYERPGDDWIMRRLVTWDGVEPGDVLTMGTPAGSAAPVLGTMTVSPPGSFPGAAAYQASSGCSDGATSVDPVALVYELHAPCHPDPARLPVLLQALDADGQPIAYAVAAEVPLVGDQASVAFDAWRTDTQSFVSSISNLPDFAPAIGLSMTLLAAGDESFGVGLTSDPVIPGSASAELPSGLAARWQFSERITSWTEPQSRWRISVADAPVPPSYTMDYSTDLLAELTSVRYDSWDVARPSASWTTDPSTGSASTQAAMVVFFLTSTDGYDTWTYVARPGVDSVRLPPLPQSMDAYRPIAPAESSIVALFDSDSLGPAFFRARLGGGAVDADVLWRVFAASAAPGTVRLSLRRFL